MRINMTQPKQSKVTQLVVQEPTELMKFLMEQLPAKGRNKVKSLLTHRQVSVGERVVTQYNHPLKSGDNVRINWGKVDDTQALEGVRILFEDPHLIVIDKPAGLLSMATDEEKHKTAYRQLMNHVRQTDPRSRIFIVHRLDRETSGVMMFAKSEQIKDQLQE